MTVSVSDEELSARQDGYSFELFYGRYFERVLAFFSAPHRQRELAADLTAETFASALVGRRRYRRQRGAADAWLFAIAYHKLADDSAVAMPRIAHGGGWEWSGSC